MPHGWLAVRVVVKWLAHVLGAAGRVVAVRMGGVPSQACVVRARVGSCRRTNQRAPFSSFAPISAAVDPGHWDGTNEHCRTRPLLALRYYMTVPALIHPCSHPSKRSAAQPGSFWEKASRYSFVFSASVSPNISCPNSELVSGLLPQFKVSLFQERSRLKGKKKDWCRSDQRTT